MLVVAVALFTILEAAVLAVLAVAERVKRLAVLRVKLEPQTQVVAVVVVASP